MTRGVGARHHPCEARTIIHPLGSKTGTVPVLIADRLPPPLDGLGGIRWRDFSLTHPEADVSPPMLKRPKGFGQIARRLQALPKHMRPP